MARISPAEANSWTDELELILRSWARSKDSDSVATQKLRADEFAIARRVVENLVYDVQPERRLQLTVGQTAVRASVFSKGAYDMYTESRRVLEPGAELTLERTEEYRTDFGDQPGPALYVGGWPTVVELGLVADTLNDNGRLTVVEVEV